MTAYRPYPQRLATVPARVLTLCAEARELIAARQFEEAAEVLSPAWAGVCQRPTLAGLSRREAAEVLLLTGSLTAHIGRKQKIVGATEQAKNLITESHRLFTELCDPHGEGRCLSELGHWYGREKSFKDAEVFLREALTVIPVHCTDDRAETVLRLVYVLDRQRRHDDTLALMREHYALLDDPSKPARRIAFRSDYAGTLKWVAEKTLDPRDIEAALEVTAEARNMALAASNFLYTVFSENNFAGMCKYVGRFVEAHDALDRATEMILKDGSADMIACVNETRTRVLLAEGRFTEAEAVVSSSLAQINEREQRGHYAETLLCAGDVAAALRRYDEAKTYYLSAIEAAQYVGDEWTEAEAACQLAEIDSSRQFDEEANISSLWAARAFPVRIKTDAMEGAGLENGCCYSFRRTRKWEDGDVVVANTPDCITVAYIYRDSPRWVRLEWTGT